MTFHRSYHSVRIRNTAPSSRVLKVGKSTTPNTRINEGLKSILCVAKLIFMTVEACRTRYGTPDIHAEGDYVHPRQQTLDICAFSSTRNSIISMSVLLNERLPFHLLYRYLDISLCICCVDRSERLIIRDILLRSQSLLTGRKTVVVWYRKMR